MANSGAAAAKQHYTQHQERIASTPSQLKHGTNSNAQDRWRQTPLHIGSQWRHLEVGYWLHEPTWTQHRTTNAPHSVWRLFTVIFESFRHFSSIMLNAQNGIGKQCHAWRQIADMSTLSGYCWNKGAEPMLRRNDQWTPLYQISECEKLGVAHLLLKRGVYMDAKNEEWNTAYQIGLKTGQISGCRSMMSSTGRTTGIWSPLVGMMIYHFSCEGKRQVWQAENLNASLKENIRAQKGASQNWQAWGVWGSCDIPVSRRFRHTTIHETTHLQWPQLKQTR